MTKDPVRPCGSGINSNIRIEAPRISTCQVFHSICDWKSLSLFDALVNEGGGSKELILKLGISRKEYYSRISKLVDTGMVKKEGRRYTITVFGRVIYEARLILANTLANHYRQGVRENNLAPVDRDQIQVILKS
jgi:predicted transcriptional regulator